MRLSPRERMGGEVLRIVRESGSFSLGEKVRTRDFNSLLAK
jgi:hypothetical protein